MAFGVGLGRAPRMRRIERELAVARQEIRAGRFQRTMSLLAAVSAVASGFEAYAQHERGAFRHWLMWTPVYLTPIATVAGVGGFFSKRVARLGLPAVAVASLLDGAIGFYYHLKGIRNLPGGFRLGQYNVVIGPPIFAPLLTGMVGIMALIASALRRVRIDWIELGAVGRQARRQARRSGWLELLTTGEFQRGLSLSAALFAALAGGDAADHLVLPSGVERGEVLLEERPGGLVEPGQPAHPGVPLRRHVVVTGAVLQLAGAELVDPGSDRDAAVSRAMRLGNDPSDERLQRPALPRVEEVVVRHVLYPVEHDLECRLVPVAALAENVPAGVEILDHVRPSLRHGAEWWRSGRAARPRRRGAGRRAAAPSPR